MVFSERSGSPRGSTSWSRVRPVGHQLPVHEPGPARRGDQRGPPLPGKIVIRPMSRLVSRPGRGSRSRSRRNEARPRSGGSSGVTGSRSFPATASGPKSFRSRAARWRSRERGGRPLRLRGAALGADRFLKTGETLPTASSEARSEFDAILLGALGDPRVPGNKHARDILFGLRFGLDLYVKTCGRSSSCTRICVPRPRPDGVARAIDLVVFRENTEGAYVNIGGSFKRGTPDGSRSTRTSTATRA